MTRFVKKLGAIALTAAMIGSVFTGCSSKTDNPKDKDTYKVGICQLMQHPALDKATKGFQDALTEMLGDKVEFSYQNASGDSAACATIANQFVSNDVDLIMANATAALQACTTATAASKIPVVATSITNFGVALDIEMGPTDATGINVTGTHDLAPLEKQAEQLTTLFPEAKNVGILYCSSEANSKFQSDGMEEILKAQGLNVNIYTFSDSNDLQAVAKKAAAASDVIYIPTDNTVADNGAVVDAACTEANTPIISGESDACAAYRGVATYSIDFYEIGYNAGKMAYEILVNGADPATMNIQAPQTLTAQYLPEKAEEFNVQIPEGYVILAAE
ncbi:MAG: ABC transporter substrate-binding protein [Eubacterium sp.]|nr:ABC transporter substrate-binding protein [Eubacterium sp.]MDE6156000.1 ABC transporter substrate-binding protein [Eubacterium sp.]